VQSNVLGNKICLLLHRGEIQTLVTIKEIRHRPLKPDLRDFQILVVDVAERRHVGRKALGSVVY
jgi:hypothetical protein